MWITGGINPLIPVGSGGINPAHSPKDGGITRHSSPKDGGITPRRYTNRGDTTHGGTPTGKIPHPGSREGYIHPGMVGWVLYTQGMVGWVLYTQGMVGYTPPGHIPPCTTPGIPPYRIPLSTLQHRGWRAGRQHSGLREGECPGWKSLRASQDPKGVKVSRRVCAELLRSSGNKCIKIG